MSSPFFLSCWLWKVYAVYRACGLFVFPINALCFRPPSRLPHPPSSLTPPHPQDPSSPEALLHAIALSEMQVIGECPLHRNVNQVELITMHSGLLFQHLHRGPLWSASGQRHDHVPLPSPLLPTALLRQQPQPALSSSPLGSQPQPHQPQCCPLQENPSPSRQWKLPLALI